LIGESIQIITEMMTPFFLFLDPHKVEDRAKLLAQIELDNQIDEIRKRQQQQVLPKPNLDPEKPKLDPEVVKSSSSSSAAPVVVVSPVKKSEKSSSGQLKSPVLQGGEDPTVKDKRDTVRAVR
jgi:hypothetical protein